MRILDNPNPMKETVITCEDCNCKFAYNRADIQYFTNEYLGPDVTCSKWVACPNCGKITYLNDTPQSKDLFIPGDDPFQDLFKVNC